MIGVRGILESYGIALCIYHPNRASATASSAARFAAENVGQASIRRCSSEL